MKQKYDSYIFLDLEMNYLKGVKDTEIIQISAIKLDRNFKEIDSFNNYIKPEYNHIYKEISNLTGITDKKVENCKGFKIIMDSFLEWLGDNYIAFAWSNNDCSQIKKESTMKNYQHEKLEYLTSHLFDFQKEFGDILELNDGKRISLDFALDISGVKFKGKRHNALYDAKNTAYLYKISRNETFKENLKKSSNFINSNTKITIGDLFDFSKINLEEDKN